MLQVRFNCGTSLPALSDNPRSESTKYLCKSVVGICRCGTPNMSPERHKQTDKNRQTQTTIQTQWMSPNHTYIYIYIYIFIFIGFGAADVTKRYKFIGFGAMDVTEPYKIEIQRITADAHTATRIGQEQREQDKKDKTRQDKTRQDHVVYVTQ